MAKTRDDVDKLLDMMADAGPADDDLADDDQPGQDAGQDVAQDAAQDDTPVPQSESTLHVVRPHRAPAVTASQTSDHSTALVDLTDRVQKDFDLVNNEILNSWRDDRDQVQSVINKLCRIVEETDQTPGGLARVHWESLVKAMEVKSNMSITAVKLLETRIKMLQAVKGGSGGNININMQGGQNPELTAILSQPVSGDFGGD